MNITGTAPLYLSNNIIKFTTSTKLTADKEFGINGWISKVGLIKSRMNRAGQEFGMVYNQETGFDRELSMYQMLHENGLVNSGVWSSFKGCEHKKFQKKSFLEKFHGDDELRRYMKCAVVDLGNSCLSNASVSTLDQHKAMADEDIDNAIFSSMIEDYQSNVAYI